MVAINKPFETYSYGSQWDKLVLGGNTLPGICRLSINLSNRWDIAKSKNMNQAYTTFAGREPCTLTAELLFTTQDEIELWVDSMQRLGLRYSASRTPSPLSIFHPQATIFGVKHVVVTNVSSPAFNAADGWTVTLNFTEYVEKPQKASKKGNDKAGGTGRRKARGTPKSVAGNEKGEIAAEGPSRPDSNVVTNEPFTFTFN